MCCGNYTGNVSRVLCREVYYTVSLFGRVHYLRFTVLEKYHLYLDRKSRYHGYANERHYGGPHMVGKKGGREEGGNGSGPVGSDWWFGCQRVGYGSGGCWLRSGSTAFFPSPLLPYHVWSTIVSFTIYIC